jgi:hypothetical protein
MDPKSPFQKIVNFLMDLGNNHNDIQQVFRWNRMELNGSFRHNPNQTNMLIDSVEVFVTNPNHNNFSQNNCAFTILGKQDVSTAKLDAYNEQNEVLEHCLEIAFEVASRIKYESTETNLQGELKWLYNNVELDSFHFFKVGPVFTQQLYGYRCEFTIKQKQCLKPDINKWKDL